MSSGSYMEDKIKAEINRMMSPGRGDDLLEAPVSLDDVAWMDFTEIHCALGFPEGPIDTNSSAEDDGSNGFSDESALPNETEMALLGDEASPDDLFHILEKIKINLIDGITANFSFAHGAKAGNKIFYFSDKLPSTEPGNLKRVYSQYFGTSGSAGYYFPTDHSSAWYVAANIDKIVNTLMAAIPDEVKADLAQSYFSLSTEIRKNFMRDLKEYFYGTENDSIRRSIPYEYPQFYMYTGSTKDEHHLTDEQLRNFWLGAREYIIGKYGVADELEVPSEPEPPAYDFLTFEDEPINVGFRLVYRQEWRHLGNQRGEIVKTIPLGPKQVEKVSTKIVRRTKVSKTAEDIRSTESTTEMSDSSKESSDIANEAKSSFKWGMTQEVDASVGIGIFSVSTNSNYSMSSDSSSATKATSSHLSETMQKMANKIRSETKVVVSTESEETYETTTSSEIQNPNEEIPITYIYSKLQRQYSVFTGLAEIQNVIMIAERLPRPEDIGFDWVKNKDWIISKVLLDDSFREALNSITHVTSDEQIYRDYVDSLEKINTSTIGHLGSLAEKSANISLSDIDIVKQSQQGYQEALKEKIERHKEYYGLELKRWRLYQHIRDNILYYMRAIWSQEDPQHRLLRYRKQGTRVPLAYQCVPRDGSEDMPIDALLGDAISLLNVTFEPVDGGDTILLADIINPAGPIGFYGNYAMYYLRPEYTGESLAPDDIIDLGNMNILTMIDLCKSPYLGQNDSGEWVVTDPLLKKMKDDYPDSNALDNALDDRTKWEMLMYVPDLRFEYALKIKEDRENKEKAENEAVSIAESAGSEGATASTSTSSAVTSGTTTDNKTEAEKYFKDNANFRKYYAEYKYRLEQTRLLLADTNSVVIDILPGEGSALEKFKQLHRGIDVLKAVEEKKKLEKENERRAKLIAGGQYGDPDIEKVSIITGDGNVLSSLVALNDSSGETEVEVE